MDSQVQQYDERMLLLQIQQSDENAFNQLFARYRNQLYTYLFKITKSRETAEEIVLDSFLKIWTGRSILGEINHFEAFLFRVAHNKAIDFFRLSQKSRLQQQEIWALMQEAVSSETADNRILHADTERSIEQAVEQLSPQRRRVFQLSREHGLSYEQIAAEMQLSSLTVRNHLSAALQFIRSHLDKGPEVAVIFTLICR